GLEIAMKDALVVRGVERARDAAKDGQRLAEREARVRGEIAVERRAFEQLHQVVLPAVGELSEREDVDDVAVPDLVDRACFLDEARHHLRVRGELTAQDLDRRALTDDRVLRAEDCAKAALAELARDAILADDVAGHE